MKVKSIGDNLSSEALKWTVTKGNDTSNGDDGSGLTGTYGFALTTKNDCSTITYT